MNIVDPLGLFDPARIGRGLLEIGAGSAGIAAAAVAVPTTGPGAVLTAGAAVAGAASLAQGVVDVATGFMTSSATSDVPPASLVGMSTLAATGDPRLAGQIDSAARLFSGGGGVMRSIARREWGIEASADLLDMIEGSSGLDWNDGTGDSRNDYVCGEYTLSPRGESPEGGD